MDVDWIVGILVFILFVAWGFSFYFALFQESENQFEIVAQAQREKIIDFLSVYVHEVPVKYDSQGDVSDGVLKAKSVWYYGEKNSTRVFSGSNPLPCRISGDDLYWQANLTSGSNGFTVQIADLNVSLNCTDTFSISSSNLTTPWAFEKKTVISLTKVDEMKNMSYEDFRNSLGLSGDLRVSVELSSGDINYGKSIPAGPINVNSNEIRRRIFETAEIANITIAVW